MCFTEKQTQPGPQMIDSYLNFLTSNFANKQYKRKQKHLHVKCINFTGREAFAKRGSFQ